MALPPEHPPLPARATIDDVARAAGVSKATVSRFLNRRDELLSKDIALRVEAAVARLGFSPSPLARSLKRGRSRLIGLVVADVTNPYSVAVLCGAEKACRDAGYMVMLFNLGNDDRREREALEALAAYQVEGFILHTLGHDAGVLDGAARRGKPVVLIDRRLGDARADLVGLDNAGAVRLGVEHLAAQGFRELLFVSEPPHGMSSREERRTAFRAAVAACDGMVDAGTLECGPDDDATLDAALLVLRRRAAPRRAAVLSASAVVTLRLAAALARLGWRMGADLGLVGFDDTDWAPLVGSGVTALAQPTDDIGRTAARCLIERLEGAEGPPRLMLLPAALVVRGSSRGGD